MATYGQQYQKKNVKVIHLMVTINLNLFSMHSHVNYSHIPFKIYVSYELTRLYKKVTELNWAHLTLNLDLLEK